MEGYMNVSGSHRNFDDLDIEGYSDWNAGDEDCYPRKVKNGEEKAVLETKVQLDDGKFAHMCSVVEKDGVSWYTCHVCTITVLGWSQFNNHIRSRLHASNVSVPTQPRAKFAKLDPKDKLPIELGEPVPPGLEEVIIATCEIQKELDAYTTGPLIGLEYLVELSNNTDDPLEYFCLLCDRRGYSRNIMVHLTSQLHYRKYISQFFRTATQKLADIPRTSETRKGASIVVVRIASRIESKFGRMKPISEPQSTFHARKFEILRSVDEGVHFRETDEDNFADCIDLEEIKSLATEEYRPPDQIVCSTKLNPDTSPVETQAKSLINKGRIGADKRQLRVRNESSPVNAEVVTVDDTPPSSPGKKPRLHSNLSSISNTSSSPSKSKSRSRSRARSRSRSISNNHRRSVYDRPRPVKRSRSDSRHRRLHSTSSPGKKPRLHSNLSSISNTSSSPSKSKSRSRSRARSRSRSISNNHRRSVYDRPRPVRRSRSDSRHRRRYRSRSLSKGGRKRSRSRSRSNERYRRHYRHRSPFRKRSPSYRADNSYSRGRSRRFPDSPPGERDRSEGRHRYNRVDVNSEKYKWEKFREDIKKMETEMDDMLKNYEKNPEKHPMYPEEWKAFWNQRYKELKADGRDPAKHDFKPEWITFWNKRMKELHDEDLKKKKEELKEKLCLPKEPAESNVWVKNKLNANPLLEDVSSPTPSKKDAIEGAKNTWKALTGSDIKDGPKRSLSPWEEEPRKTKDPGSSDRRGCRSFSPRESKPRGGHEVRSREGGSSRDKGSDDLHIISVLRQTTVLENQLGSLGPKAVDLLTKALALEKLQENGSRAILLNPDDCMLLETVKEKMKGNLFAGVVARNTVNTTRSAIAKIECLLQEVPRKGMISHPLSALISQPISAIMSHSLSTISAVQKRDPVVVPGVGTIDKVAIAEQIAKALVAQGKTDVTEAELEQLINAVIGMSQASVNSSQTMTTAAYVSQIQTSQAASVPVENTPVPLAQDVSTPAAPMKLLQPLLDENKAVSSDKKPDVTINKPAISDPSVMRLDGSINSTADTPSKQEMSSLSKLGVVYKSPDRVENESDPADPIEELSESDVRNLLQNFSELPKDEQVWLITYLRKLETVAPEKIRILQPLITPDILPPKKVPITIQLSKQKSEQKVKPINSGRLSPFSMRMGGINPTADELDDEIRNDDVVEIKPIAKSTDKKDNVKTVETKNKNFHDDDDDKYGEDDDDVDEYSFEDVYKAASEKVWLKQMETNKKKEEIEKEKNKSSGGSEEFSMKDNNIVIPPSELFESILGKASGSLPAMFSGSEQTLSESDNQSQTTKTDAHNNIPLLQNSANEKPEYQINLSNYAQFASRSSDQMYSGQMDNYNSTNMNSYVAASQNYSQTVAYPSANSSNMYSNQANTYYSSSNYPAIGVQNYPSDIKSSVIGNGVHSYPQNSVTNSYMSAASNVHMDSDRGNQGYDRYPQQNYNQQTQQKQYQQQQATQQYGGNLREYDDYRYNNSNSNSNTYSGQYGRQSNTNNRPRQGYPY